MANDRSSLDYRGIVPPFPLTLVEGSSTYVEQSPRVGLARPATGSRSSGVLVASGTQSAGGELEVHVRRPGVAGQAEVVWRAPGDSRWHGQDRPSVATAWEPVVITTGLTAGLVAVENPHAITLQGDEVLIAYVARGTSPSAFWAIRTQTRAADGSSIGSAVSVYSSKVDLTRGFHPCLLELPSGRVLLFHGTEPSSTRWNLRVGKSDDKGATWTIWSSAAIEGGVATTARNPGRLRAAYANGQILLMMDTREVATDKGTSASHDSLWQWASVDFGASFQAVRSAPSWAAQEAGAFADLLVIDGVFVLVWARFNAGNYFPTITRLASAYDDYVGQSYVSAAGVVTVATATQPTGSSYETVLGDLAATLDDAGRIWVWYQNGDSGTPTWEGNMIYSPDGGVTVLEVYGDDPIDIRARWWACADSSTTPRRYAATWWRGQALLAMQWDATGNTDNSIALLHLGGWATVNMPRFASDVASQGSLNSPTWNQTWLPLDEPGDVTGWTASGAGADALDGGELVITTTANTRYYEGSGYDGAISQGLLVSAHVQVDSGGSLAAGVVALGLRMDDGAASESYEVQINFMPTGFRVLDVEAGATIGSDVVADLTAGIFVLVMISDLGVLVAWCAATPGDARTYIVSHLDALTDGGGSSAVRRVQWGHLASSSAVSRWRFVGVTHQNETGIGISDGQDSPDEQWGVRLGTRPIYLHDGVRVRAEGGPFGAGEEWEVDATADWPVTATLYRDMPSRRRQFRSATGSPPAAVTLTWRIEDGYSTPGLQDGTIALILTSCNWRTATLYRESASGVWTSIAAIDLSTGQNLIPYTRSGNTVYLDTSGTFTGPWFVHRNALIGATVNLGSGKLRRVRSNTPGMWTTAGILQRPILTLEDVDDTEPASGNMIISMHQAAIVVHSAGSDALAAGYRLVVDSQATVDGDLRLKAHLGPVVAFAIHPDSARTQTRAAPYDEQRFVDGSRHRTRRGPVARTVSMAWVNDGISTHTVGGASPSPDYALGTTGLSAPTGARPIASLGAEPETVLALVEGTDGQRLPVGYLAYVARGTTTPDVKHLLRPDLFMIGWIDGELSTEERQPSQISSGVGQEWRGALTNIATFTISEVP